VSVRDCTSTDSSARSRKPAAASIRAARAASPSDCSMSVSLVVPAKAPAAIATATNATHTAVADFQCAALQRPARSARFSLIEALRLGYAFQLSLPPRLLAAHGGTRRRVPRVPPASGGVSAPAAPPLRQLAEAGAKPPRGMPEQPVPTPHSRHA